MLNSHCIWDRIVGRREGWCRAVAKHTEEEDIGSAKREHLPSKVDVSVVVAQSVLFTSVPAHVCVVMVVTTGGMVVTLGENELLVLVLATEVYSVAVAVGLHAIRRVHAPA